MPMLTNLADVVRTSGLQVVEVVNWKTRGHGAMQGVKTVVPHHTAGPATGDMPSLNIVVNGRPGLDGPLSHLALSRSGIVYVIAAGQAWHTGAVRNSAWGNPWAIGIEAEAVGTQPWPATQVDAYSRLCAALVRGYGLQVEDVRAHKEICSPVGRKIDPNFDMTDFRARVAAHLVPTPVQDPTGFNDYEVRQMQCEAGTKKRVYIPCNGKPYLYIMTGFGNRVDFKAWGIGATNPATNTGTYLWEADQYVSADRPGPIDMRSRSIVGVTLEYTSAEPFTAWCWD